ncbi:hypothetical protein, partial [Rhodococcus sp. IEGM 1307]|uniref:hypothetical protein n=1 Tax=Rhodococcus sp. IEGM 1307 TaxID=3047091 RepID=UPI0024B77B11
AGSRFGNTYEGANFPLLASHLEVAAGSPAPYGRSPGQHRHRRPAASAPADAAAPPRAARARRHPSPRARTLR